MIPITSDKRYKDNNNYLWIQSTEHPKNQGKVWGYLGHEYECGWFLMATEEGEQLEQHMKIILKTKEQFEGKQSSHFILIKDKMQICLAGNFAFECDDEDD